MGSVLLTPVEASVASLSVAAIEVDVNAKQKAAVLTIEAKDFTKVVI
jgi:hypothetical protein